MCGVFLKLIKTIKIEIILDLIFDGITDNHLTTLNGKYQPNI